MNQLQGPPSWLWLGQFNHEKKLAKKISTSLTKK